jgi:hypothetical protein
MADFITAGQEYSGKENKEIILRPLAEKMGLKELGITPIFTDKASSVRATFFGAVKKILMPFISGFQGGKGAEQLQKKFELAEFKAEMALDKQDYKDTILWEIVNNQGVKQNDISGTNVMAAEQEVFNNAIMNDVIRIFFLGAKDKLHNVSGAYPDATAFAKYDADKYYNTIDGIWQEIESLASLNPTANQVKRTVIEHSTAAVKEVQTLTLTGTSGTGNINVDGVDYLATFNTDLTTTASDFVTAHASVLAGLFRGLVVTSSGADLIFVSSDPGQAHTITFTNVTLTLAGSIVETNANVSAFGLAAGKAHAVASNMFYNASKQLKSLKSKGKLRYYFTDDLIENYEQELATITSGIPETYYNMVDGVKRLMLNGIPIMPISIDEYIEDDFDGVYPSRAVLTTPDNLHQVLSDANGFAETRFWFNPDENQNRQRTQFEFGGGFVLPELISVGY